MEVQKLFSSRTLSKELLMLEFASLSEMLLV